MTRRTGVADRGVGATLETTAGPLRRPGSSPTDRSDGSDMGSMGRGAAAEGRGATAARRRRPLGRDRGSGPGRIVVKRRRPAVGSIKRTASPPDGGQRVPTVGRYRPAPVPGRDGPPGPGRNGPRGWRRQPPNNGRQSPVIVRPGRPGVPPHRRPRSGRPPAGLRRLVPNKPVCRPLPVVGPVPVVIASSVPPLVLRRGGVTAILRICNVPS